MPISYYYVVNITNQNKKYAMKINLKVPSIKNEKKERKKKSSNRMLDQMCLKKLKKRLYFERSIFALSPLPTHIHHKNSEILPQITFFWSDCNKKWSESVSEFCRNLYLLPRIYMRGKKNATHFLTYYLVCFFKRNDWIY